MKHIRIEQAVDMLWHVVKYLIRNQFEFAWFFDPVKELKLKTFNLCGSVGH